MESDVESKIGLYSDRPEKKHSYTETPKSTKRNSRGRGNDSKIAIQWKQLFQKLYSY